MLRTFVVFFTILLTSLLAQAELKNDLKNICGSFYIDEHAFAFFNSLDLSKNEEILICGDEDVQTWSQVPEWQAIKNLKSFLKGRGYFFPQLTEKNDKLIIDPGKKTKILSLSFLNSPKGFKKAKFLGLKYETLNSKNLNQIETWAKAKLEQLGFPCPKLKTQANAKTGKVTITFLRTEKSIISQLKREAPPGVRKKALSRFDAFKVGDYYNGQNLSLTSRRLQTSGLADYSDFTTDCSSDDQNRTFKQRLTYSKPQSLILAVGGTTEQLPILKLSWKHSRLDQNASQMYADLFLSSVEQSLTTSVQWHTFNNLPRLYFLPEAKFARYSERVYTSINQVLSYGLGYMHDDSAKRILLLTKPTYTIEDRSDDSGPEHTEFLSLESSVSVFNHDFEYNQQNPKDGYELGLNWSLRQKGLGSDLSGNMYKFSGTYLHSWGGFSPPLFVLGLRFQYASLITDNLKKTPSRLRLFLGGNNDIRGFARKSVNNDDLGFRTTAYLGSELRLLKVLPYHLQPFIFVDTAQVGIEANELDSNLLWAPGLGFRWQSPIGAVRSTLAKGFVESHSKYDISEQWTFFLSLGSEF